MLRHTTIDGYDFAVVPQGYSVFKAMGIKGMTTEKMNAYLESKGNPTVSWFGERSNAEWYLKNWYEDGGELYEYRFERDGFFFEITPANIKKLVTKFKKNTLFTARLKCFTGVGLSEHEQYTKCALKYSGDDYPPKLKEKEMSDIKDDELKRYSIHDLDLEVAKFLCKNLKLKSGVPVDGYYSDDVRSDYGVLPVFPLEFATCFAKDLLTIVSRRSSSPPSYVPMPKVSPPKTPPPKTTPYRSATRSPTPQRMLPFEALPPMKSAIPQRSATRSPTPQRSATRSPTPQRSPIPHRSATRSPTPQRSPIPHRSATRSPTPQRSPIIAEVMDTPPSPVKKRTKARTAAAKKKSPIPEFTMKLRNKRASPPPAKTKMTLRKRA
jgi:hypothetical protein